MGSSDFIIVGGGIVGLATGYQLGLRFPDARIVILEKESDIAQHQTGRNSGVIHSGIYYKPGSFKARFARAGCQSMVAFCREHEIPFEVCGKLIVATRESELPQLQALEKRGRENGIEVRRLLPAQAQEKEPAVHCIAAIEVPSTGIVSYRQVSRQYLQCIQSRGGTLHTQTRVLRCIRRGTGWVVETDRGDFETDFLINCAGLHSDRVAQSAGADVEARIVPFRGEYYELRAEKRSLVRGLIYPVPNPAFPFLGVHFTRMIDGSVHAGPNAVLALKREGYRRTDLDWADAYETLSYVGFWKLARRHWREGSAEMVRSWSKAAFVRSLQELIPSVQSEDLVPCNAGVRAQALLPGGQLVDDFLLVPGDRALHVCNAPSPAATASLEIGKSVASAVAEALPSGD